MTTNGIAKARGNGSATAATITTIASSEAIIVRDKIVARIKKMPFFAGFYFDTNKNTAIDPRNIPFAGVYFINEDLTPDGDANAGEVRFRSMAMYGISVIVQNNDAVQAEYRLDQAWNTLTVGMFSDPTLYNWKNVGKAGEVAIQSYTRGNRSHQFGNAGADNAIPIAELRFTLTCDLGTLDYEPVIVDDLKTVHIETRFPTADTNPAEVQQVDAEYDIEVAS